MEHHGMVRRTVLATLILASLTAPLWAQPATSQPGSRTRGPAKLDDVRIYLVLKDGSRLIGELAGFDKYVVRVRDQQGKLHSAKWDQLLPLGCYHLQKRLTDPNLAEVQFRLGHYCWNNNLRDLAYDHFAIARRLDPDYAERIKQAVTGKGVPVELAVALVDPRELEELERLERAGPVTSSQVIPRPGRIVKYQPFSPETQAKALEQIRQFGAQVNEKFKTQLRTVETEHFILFTQWPASEDRAVGEMFEAIYSRLAAQFDIPVGENIYLGKLPVFCWNTREEFARFAWEAHKFNVGNAVMAYVFANLSGFQQMNMFRYPNRVLLEKIVAHECVHTFVLRYKSNVPLEVWLNEGLAEVMAGALVPRSRTIERARTQVAASINTIEIMKLLKAGYGPFTATDYPIATTLVDYLMRLDSRKFLDMIDRIKAGAATETALKEAFGFDYAGFATVWRRWVAAGFPDRPK